MATLGAQDYELRDATTGSNNAEVSMVVSRIVLLIFCSEIYGGLVLHMAFIVACSINLGLSPRSVLYLKMGFSLLLSIEFCLQVTPAAYAIDPDTIDQLTIDVLQFY